MLFVGAVTYVFAVDTGLVEKAVLAAAAVLLALAVPRIRQLGRPPARPR